mmetsp:Transcript_3253/g.4006  ORF Transcript_3253/g.4006 Transcript_3253/m.4006 type:complete len:86 (+) Transcript_3253:33-290(+)
MGRVHPPELKKFMDKRLCVKLNANRKVTGVLRGYDQFMNLVLENAMEEVSAENRAEIGTVVRFLFDLALIFLVDTYHKLNIIIGY